MKKNEKRAVLRYPYRSSVIYSALGYRAHPPDKTEIPAEIMDLSDSGIRLRTEGKALDEGKMVWVKIPVADIDAAVPTLALVIWTKKQDAKAYHAGLKFVL